MTQLLAQGWGQNKVRQQHLAYAVPLVDRGVTWRGLDDRDEDDVAGLVHSHIPGVGLDWTIDPRSGGIVAEDPGQQIIAALVVAGMDLQGQLVAIIHQLVVAPEWRGQGVGAVTLGTAHQIFTDSQQPAIYVGQCAPEQARFYQRAGYTVLQPGEVLTLRGAAAAMGISNSHHPCWMYREW